MNEMSQEILDLLNQSENESDLRSQALKTTLGFKSSWLLLAEKLRDIDESRAYLDWEFTKFFDYCQEELQLNRGMVKKLIQGLDWLESEAPEYKPHPNHRSEKNNLPRPVPDIETISALSRGLRESEEKRLPYNKYLEIRDAALAGDTSLNQVKKELREAVPQEIREAEVDPVRHIKRALTEVEKALNKWTETDPADDKTIKVAEVRDGLYEIVSSVVVNES